MINIIVKLAASKNIRLTVDPSITVGDFKKRIADQEGVEGVKLVYKAKPLTNDSVTLSDVGVTNNCTMFAALRVLGGSGSESDSESDSDSSESSEGGCHQMDENLVNKYKGDVATIVTSNCIIDASDGCKVPKIKKLKLTKCGCTFCPDCMRFRIKVLKENHFEIVCGSGHNTFLPLDLSLAAAGYSAAKTDKKQAHITENWMRVKTAVIKICPNAKCGSWIYRGDNLGKVNRVRCPLCKAYDFCWFCLGKWKGSGGKVCGNDGCDLRASYVSLLQNSDMKRLNGIDNVPDTRICVNVKCSAINIHAARCKHITCNHCKTQYCQSCLNIWEKDHLSDICVPAKTQEITNEMYLVMK